MRYVTMSALLALTAVLWIPGTCAAQQIPGGSYQQTCRDIGVRGSTLYATCQDTGGGWQSTELRDFQRCGAEIQNINGQLQCSTGGYQGYGPGPDRGPYHDRDHGYSRWPGGSYTLTCQNINISGNTLQASCQKKNGKWKQTSLKNYNRCVGEIINNNGKLQCTR
jgi:CVNH domain